MHGVSNEHEPHRRDASDGNAGPADRPKGDSSASYLEFISENIFKPCAGQKSPSLCISTPVKVMELLHETVERPGYQNAADNSPVAPYGITCDCDSKSSVQVDNFLARNGVAHDIKNLLQVISSGICIADARIREGRFEEVPKILERIDEAVHRVNDGLRVMQRGVLSRDPRASVVDIEKSLERLGDSLHWAIGSSNRLEMAVASGLPAICCVESEFENVILNLVINARDAMPEGGRATIEVVRAARSGADAGVIIRVHDTGVGMSTDVATKAFKPYFTTKGSDGSGLGLTMVASFARSAGGSAWIDHSSAGGTTVAMYLPNTRRN